MKNANGYKKRFKPKKHKKRIDNNLTYPVDKDAYQHRYTTFKELSIINKKTNEVQVLIRTKDLKPVGKVYKNIKEFFKKEKLDKKYIVCWLEDEKDVESKWLTNPTYNKDFMDLEEMS